MTARGSRRALLIVDVEPKFVTSVTRKAIPRIARLVEAGEYALVVVAEYTDAEAGAGVRHKKDVRIHPDEETVPEVADLLDPKKTLRVVKTTRSLFGNEGRLAAALRRRRIGEVHIAGLETHDCVLATALDAFDHGFMTRVIEGACASKDEKLHRAAITILRRIGIAGSAR